MNFISFLFQNCKCATAKGVLHEEKTEQMLAYVVLLKLTHFFLQIQHSSNAAFFLRIHTVILCTPNYSSHFILFIFALLIFVLLEILWWNAVFFVKTQFSFYQYFPLL